MLKTTLPLTLHSTSVFRTAEKCLQFHSHCLLHLWIWNCPWCFLLDCNFASPLSWNMEYYYSVWWLSSFISWQSSHSSTSLPLLYSESVELSSVLLGHWFSCNRTTDFSACQQHSFDLPCYNIAAFSWLIVFTTVIETCYSFLFELGPYSTVFFGVKLYHSYICHSGPCMWHSKLHSGTLIYQHMHKNHM
jgi:hypothetical protein